MARPGLLDHRKFKRLVHLLKEPIAHCVGYLECLWTVAYQARKAFIGDAIDVELSAGYPGEPGRLCGILAEVGFLDQLPGDKFGVHNLKKHAPRHVIAAIEKAEKEEAEKSQLEFERSKPDLSATLSAQNQTYPPVSAPIECNGKINTPLPPKGEGGFVYEKTAGGMAVAWVFYLSRLRGRKKADADIDAVPFLEELLRRGIPADALAAEIENPGRDRTEQLFQFKNRMLEAYGKNRSPPPTLPFNPANDPGEKLRKHQAAILREENERSKTASS